MPKSTNISVFKMCKAIVFENTTKDSDGFLTHHFINDKEKIKIELETSCYGSAIFVKRDRELIYSPFNHYLCHTFNIFQVLYIHIKLRLIRLRSKKARSTEYKTRLKNYRDAGNLIGS